MGHTYTKKHLFIWNSNIIGYLALSAKSVNLIDNGILYNNENEWTIVTWNMNPSSKVVFTQNSNSDKTH